jgi:hypothetical protein
VTRKKIQQQQDTGHATLQDTAKPSESNPTILGDLPFQQIELAENRVIRTFDSDVSESELKWHWDEEDRLIKILNKPDWLLQIDNAFPVALEENQLHYIREGVWHRLIKGTTNLIVEITKIKTYGRTSSNQSSE